MNPLWFRGSSNHPFPAKPLIAHRHTLFYKLWLSTDLFCFRKAIFRGALWSVGALILLSCAAPSVQQSDARDRQGEYERAYTEFYNAEKEYLNILFNLETHPQDSFLVSQKNIKRQEIEHLRNLMLQSRSEFDQSVIQWEAYVNELRSMPTPSQPVPPNQPTSPGHLVEPPKSIWD